jgi:hypothetical protein
MKGAFPTGTPLFCAWLGPQAAPLPGHCLTHAVRFRTILLVGAFRFEASQGHALSGLNPDTDAGIGESELI